MEKRKAPSLSHAPCSAPAGAGGIGGWRGPTSEEVGYDCVAAAAAGGLRRGGEVIGASLEAKRRAFGISGSHAMVPPGEAVNQYTASPGEVFRAYDAKGNLTMAARTAGAREREIED